MKRIIGSMAVLALAAVFAMAQEAKKVEVVKKDGKTTITVNGKVVKVIEGDLTGDPITIDGATIVVKGSDQKGAKTVTGKTLFLSKDSKPVVVDGKKFIWTDDSKVTVVDKGKVYEKVLVPGKQPLVVYRTNGGGQVVVDPKVDYIATDGGMATKIVKAEGVRAYQDKGGDDAKIKELQKRIESLHHELAELMKKRHGSDPGQKKLLIEEAEGMKMDAAKTKELGLKMAEQAKQHREIALKEHGGLIKLKELEGMKMLDEKQHKQLMEQLHKEMAGKHQLNEKQHLELMQKLEKSMPKGQAFEFKFDEKLDPKMMEKLHQAMAGKHKLDEKQHMELMKKLEKDMAKGQKFDFTFDEKMFEKMDPKMMEKLHQEMAGMQHKFEFKFDDKEMQLFEKMGQEGGMYYRMEGKDGKFKLVPGTPGKVKMLKDQDSQEPTKRFFDEPFFQTPEPTKKAKSKKKAYKVITAPQPKMTRVLAPARIARVEAIKEIQVTTPKVALEAIPAGQVARTEALKRMTVTRPAIALEAVRAGQIARAEAVKGLATTRSELARMPKLEMGSSEAALRAKIAALEEAIRALKEENAKLKEKKAPPPAPKVSVTSRRAR